MKLCAIGDNCIDYYPELGKGYPGGNPVNVAVYFRREGGESSYIGAVGTDDFGKLLVAGLNSKSVDTSHIHIVDGKTALTEVKLIDGDRVFGDYDEGVMADFALSPEDRDFVLKHDLIISGFWGHCNQEFKGFKAAGIKTAFDFATKLEDPAVRELIADIDYAFFSYDADDLEWLKNYMQTVHSRESQLIVATRGEKGSICFDGKDFHEGGIIPCDLVDTIGAGDSYIAAFLHSILSGNSISESMIRGAKSSAITIAYKGAW